MNTPSIRFPEFHDEWRLYQVKDIIKIYPKTKLLSSKGQLTGKYKFFTNASHDQCKYLDTYSFDGEYLVINTGGQAFTNYVCGPFNVSADCLVFKILKHVTKFSYFVLKKDETRINHFGFQGITIKHLQTKWFLTQKYYFPSLSEQSHLSSFFTLIDQKIEIIKQQRKLLAQYQEKLHYLLFDFLITHGESRRFLELFKQIKIKNDHLVKQYTVGKHGLKIITNSNYDLHNHQIFFKNCLLIGLGLDEVAFSDQISIGCVSPIYHVYHLKDNDYLNAIKYTLKLQLWSKKFISKKSTRRQYELDHEAIKKITIKVARSQIIFQYGNVLEYMQKKIMIVEKIYLILKQIKKYLLNDMLV